MSGIGEPRAVDQRLLVDRCGAERRGAALAHQVHRALDHFDHARRVARIGQTRAVNVYRLVSTGTIEEKVVALQERKRDLFRTVVDAGEFRSGTITAQDIRGLLER